MRLPSAEAVAQVGRAEPAVAFDVDPRQLSFDDLHCDDARRDVLVGDDRAGGQVALVDVE